MKVSLRIEGGDRLARTLAQLPERTSRKMLRDTLVKVVATPIQQMASAMAPVAPGAPDLADHIVVSAGRGSKAAVVNVGPSKESRSDEPQISYGLQGFYVEYGTNDTPAHPFLRPAFDGTAHRTLGEFAGEVWHALISKGITSTRGGGFSGGGDL